jgi:hypothetical protein
MRGFANLIVAIGLDVDGPYSHFIERADAEGVAVLPINLRQYVEGDWQFHLPPEKPGILEGDAGTIELHPDASYYCRMIDLSTHESDAAKAKRWRGLLNALRIWLDWIPGKVANRPGAGSHNSAKPLHEAILVDLGLRVPESLTSCDADVLRSFVRDGPTISKTVCGVRADTAIVTETDFIDFDPLSGPVHIQRMVKGADVRIHVIGPHLVAQRADTDAIDYRREGGIASLVTFEPPDALAGFLVGATREIGLEFAGWDFKLDAEGNFWCLEVNPMPGYSVYDERCDGAISRALFKHLGTEQG